MNTEPAFILYAEDDEEDRLLFLDCVQHINNTLHIVTAENGHEVVNYLAGKNQGQPLPLAIVSDLRMPLCDGLDMLRTVKQDIRWKQIPVILFSTSSSSAEMSRARNLGVDAFLTKPATYQELTETVRSILTICLQYAQVD